MKKEIADTQEAQTKCLDAHREFNRTSAISPPICQTSAFLAESSEHFAALAKSVRPSEYYSRYGDRHEPPPFDVSLDGARIYNGLTNGLSVADNEGESVKG